MKSVTVVGGGAVGLCVAEALASREVPVRLVEAGRCGMGASPGNAGWITPSLGVPVPGPGVIGQSLRWLVNPSGPLWIRPTLSPALLSWIGHFVVRCRRPAYRRALAVLQAAVARAGESFDRLGERGASFELHSEDLLYPAFSVGELDHLVGVAADLRAAGSRLAMDRLSSADGTEARACAQPTARRGHAGGRRESGAARIVAGRACKPASAWLGAEVVENSPVQEIRRQGSGWTVIGETDSWRADAVVLANGVQAGALLRRLGVRLSIVAAKGYSRTFEGVSSGPSRPLYLEEPKVAISVFDGAARVSGTLELGAVTLELSARRLAAITAAAREALPGWQIPEASADWAGMRSLSPDGVPYVGPIAGHDGLFVAAGHATLGITLAPLTGELLCDQIVGDVDDPLLAAFDPARL